DRNEIHVFLVAGGYGEAVVFPADNQLVPSNELLYKRELVLAPAGFDSASQLYANPVRDTLIQLPKGELAETKGRLGLSCLSVTGERGEGSKIRRRELMNHLKTFQELTHGVMLFRARELYKMCSCVNRYPNSSL